MQKRLPQQPFAHTNRGGPWPEPEGSSLAGPEPAGLCQDRRGPAGWPDCPTAYCQELLRAQGGCTGHGPVSHRKAFTDGIITPLVNAIAGGGKGGKGLGWTINNQHIDVGAFIGALIYFAILMAVIYYVIVVPYRAYMKRRGRSVFGDPPPTKTCPNCQSTDIPAAATKCKYCASELSVAA